MPRSPARPPCRPLRLMPAAAGLAFAAAVFAALEPSAPVPDFHLPVFDAATGHKTYDLRGATAIYRSAQLIELDDFVVLGFDLADRADLEVRSPKALLHVKERVAEGDSPIHVWAPEYVIQGRDWRWEERENHVDIRQDVRVTINASLGSLIK